MGKHEKERDGFKSRTGFILACIGSAVGMGNIWRFPYLAAKYGGGIFLLIYIILALTFGYSMIVAETALGRMTRKSPVGAFGKFGKSKWLSLGGWINAIIPVLIVPYYSVIGGWVIKYLIEYVKGNSQKLAEVHAMAASIAAALAVPVSEELIRRVLMVCWAYGESLMDVRILLAGGKVPVVKDSASWQLAISRLAGVGDEQSKKGTKGLDYTGYLELLLQLQTEKNNIRRGMDMVELGMRGQEKKSSFSLDHCIEAASIELSARVSGAGTVRAVEYRSYEN